MGKLKTAIIGCGNIFKVHADSISKMDEAELSVVVDINEGKAKKAGELYRCDYCTDYKKLKDENIDIAHICTPHYLHDQMAIELMEAGIEVLVEKPLAINVKQGLKVLDIKKKTGRKLGLVFQNRFNENSLRAKKMIDRGSLGKVLGIKGIVTWFRDEDYYLQDDWRGSYETEGGGVLINQAIHTLDLIQWFGGQIDAVKGTIDTRVLQDVIEVEDTAEASIYFRSGVSGIFYATNCFSRNSPVEIEIHCEKGIITLRNDKLIISGNEEDLSCADSSKNKYKSYWGYGHQKLIKGFYKDILNNTNDFTIGIEEGLKTLKIIEAINYSSKHKEKYYLSGGDNK